MTHSIPVRLQRAADWRVRRDPVSESPLLLSEDLWKVACVINRPLCSCSAVDLPAGHLAVAQAVQLTLEHGRTLNFVAKLHLYTAVCRFQGWAEYQETEVPPSVLELKEALRADLGYGDLDSEDETMQDEDEDEGPCPRDQLSASLLSASNLASA